MWGSGNQQINNEMSPVNASPSNTRSPCQTPKPNHSISLFNNQTSSIHSQQNPHHEKCNNKSLETQNNSHHIKWNGNSSVNTKEVISIFPIHHNNEAFSQPASTNALHESYHSNHHLHRNSSEITNCEVWPTAYSQYQYFSYHHVPNAHHQHQASTQWVYLMILCILIRVSSTVFISLFVHDLNFCFSFSFFFSSISHDF